MINSLVDILWRAIKGLSITLLYVGSMVLTSLAIKILINLFR